MFIFIITLLRDPDKIRRENFRCLYKLSFNCISLEISKKFFKFKMSALFFRKQEIFSEEVERKTKTSNSGRILDICGKYATALTAVLSSRTNFFYFRGI